MRIAVASGKGGTGKTTVATSLALVAEGDVQFIDCDVEEPNGHIFLKPAIETVRIERVPVPYVNEDACAGCGTCADFCAFNAIAHMVDKPIVFVWHTRILTLCRDFYCDRPVGT